MGSNNTNKLSPQERQSGVIPVATSSNNTNKLSPQERAKSVYLSSIRSNNTNKLSPQEQAMKLINGFAVQIIQINLVLKN